MKTCKAGAMARHFTPRSLREAEEKNVNAILEILHTAKVDWRTGTFKHTERRNPPTLAARSGMGARVDTVWTRD